MNGCGIKWTWQSFSSKPASFKCLLRSLILIVTCVQLKIFNWQGRDVKHFSPSFVLIVGWVTSAAENYARCVTWTYSLSLSLGLVVDWSRHPVRILNWKFWLKIFESIICYDRWLSHTSRWEICQMCHLNIFSVFSWSKSCRRIAQFFFILLNFSEFLIPGLEKRAADLVGFERAVASVSQFGRVVMKRVEIAFD